MASYAEFRDSLMEDDAMSGYRGLLTKIQYCINLLEELESDRSYKDWVSDWVVGERSSLNIDRTRNNLKCLYDEIGKGLKLNTDLFSLIPKAKLIQQSLQLRIKQLDNSGMDTSQLMESYDSISSTNKDFYNRISKAVDKIRNTGVFQEIQMDTENVDNHAVTAGVTSVAATFELVVSTSGIAAVTNAIHRIAHAYGQKRGVEYQELKLLSESLHDLRLLSEFQTHNVSLTEINKGFEGNIIFYEKEVDRIQSFILATQTRPQENTQTSPTAPATLDDGIKATQIYYKTFQENLQSLEESEPDMNEEMRKRTTTKLAETACKTFLKEKLNYSDNEVTEFLRKMQT